MREFIRRCFLSGNTKKNYDGFSEFFLKSSNDEKKELFSRVVEKANEDQRDIIDKYNRKYSVSK